ncbi:MAG: hypothetical protein JWM76_4264 [Pseudonocardiales bacterium]|nr:hypothetical protein [Pseudonocardiales bacterium]
MFTLPPTTATRRRLVTATALLTVGAIALSSCAAGSSSDPVAFQKLVPNTITATDEPIRFPFIGEPETITVPAGVTEVQVTVAAGSGGGGVGGGPSPTHLRSGRGVVLTGTLSVTPGEQLTLGIGGRGGAFQGNKNPGAGGWGMLPQYQGGRGGGAYGADSGDGDGGGGATVIMDGSTPLVIAAGGGGMGGRLSLLQSGGFSGGDATSGDGKSGSKMSNGTGGRGGSDALPNLNPQGGTAPHTVLAGGGGGGGGGVHPGEGGDKSGTSGGFGGGSGQSYSSNLTSLTSTVNDAASDGYIIFDWPA